jgi:excisionase family DNA binding protein
VLSYRAGINLPKEVLQVRSMLLRQAEFARQIGVSESTVKRWLTTGRVAFVRLPGGERRVPSDEVERILSTHFSGESYVE